MRIEIIATPFFGANALVLMPDDTTTALVVDPSAGVQDRIRATLDTNGRTVAGVLCTHGHADHVWDAAEIASWATGGAPAPVWIPGPDRHRLETNPLGDLPFRPDGLDLGEWRTPADLRDMPAGSVELVDGIWLLMVPAPGHTEGSALFLGNCDLSLSVDGTVVTASDTPVPWALTGDVIFSGSVGRTDLPGGDETAMRHSLRTIANAIDPRTLLLPGHGPVTTLDTELDTNPYLARARQIG